MAKTSVKAAKLIVKDRLMTTIQCSPMCDLINNLEQTISECIKLMEQSVRQEVQREK